jgi:hypothetical protein
VNYIPESSGLHWPNGRVPYQLESGFSDIERNKITTAILFFELNTCIRWVGKQNNDSNWVYITRSGNGCVSGVGFNGVAGEKLNLGEGCFSLVTIIHEMMHRIGFIHEQSRPDRDEHVEIIEENINKCNKKIQCNSYK